MIILSETNTITGNTRNHTGTDHTYTHTHTLTQQKMENKTAVAHRGKQFLFHNMSYCNNNSKNVMQFNLTSDRFSFVFIQFSYSMVVSFLKFALNFALYGLAKEKSLMNIDEELFQPHGCVLFLIEWVKTNLFQTNLNIFKQTIHGSLSLDAVLIQWMWSDREIDRYREREKEGWRD